MLDAKPMDSLRVSGSPVGDWVFGTDASTRWEAVTHTMAALDVGEPAPAPVREVCLIAFEVGPQPGVEPPFTDVAAAGR